MQSAPCLMSTQSMTVEMLEMVMIWVMTPVSHQEQAPEYLTLTKSTQQIQCIQCKSHFEYLSHGDFEI